MTSGATWLQGDFNYDGAVDVTDLGDLASGYGSTLAAATEASTSAAAGASASGVAMIGASAASSAVAPTASVAATLSLSQARRVVSTPVHGIFSTTPLAFDGFASDPGEQRLRSAHYLTNALMMDDYVSRAKKAF
jgi:hypothetical protein